MELHRRKEQKRKCSTFRQTASSGMSHSWWSRLTKRRTFSCIDTTNAYKEQIWQDDLSSPLDTSMYLSFLAHSFSSEAATSSLDRCEVVGVSPIALWCAVSQGVCCPCSTVGKQAGDEEPRCLSVSNGKSELGGKSKASDIPSMMATIHQVLLFLAVRTCWLPGTETKMVLTI